MSGLILVLILNSVSPPVATSRPQIATTVRPVRVDYAVVVSKTTAIEAGWKDVVEALRRKHNGRVIAYKGSVDDSETALASAMPRYACFVAKPEECGRNFVIAVHRMTRRLDDDPYTDVIWGILTGYDAADALRIARHKEPLVIRRGAAGCGLDLSCFEEGRWYSEGEQGVMYEKLPGGQAEKKKCPADATETIVKTLIDYKPQIFATSGHATHRDWQIAYSFKGGQFRCQDGQLYALDVNGKRIDIHSPNPKLYFAGGNCLIGMIADRQTMALAWMHSGGAYQMVGYTVSTWFGYGGWGVRDYFLQGDRFTFAESFYLNNQALVHELASRFPKSVGVNFDRWDIEHNEKLIDEMAAANGLSDRDQIGCLWDRDTVAFYGDPAWEARMAPVRKPAWDQTLVEKADVFTFEVKTREAGNWSRPPMALLPRRVKDVEVTEGKELGAVITDNFILVPKRGGFQAGESYKVAFRAQG